MSGHSHWATIKRAKGAADAKKGKIFSKLGKEITIVVKAKGGDPANNPTLRTLIAKACTRGIKVPPDKNPMRPMQPEECPLFTAIAKEGAA